MIADRSKHPLVMAKVRGEASTCQQCIFFLRQNEWGPGECRRHAPATFALSRAADPVDRLLQWPTVDAIDWCGEFLRNPNVEIEDREWDARRHAVERQKQEDRELVLERERERKAAMTSAG